MTANKMLKTKMADLLLEEAKRQDAFTHETAARLTTKIGLYLVFCAFVFNGEVSLMNLSSRSAIGVRGWLVFVALAAVFFSILILLWAASIRPCRVPPLIEQLKDQFQQMDSKYRARGDSEDESLAGLKGKLINSLSRCVNDNHNRNQRVASQIKLASGLLGLSVFFLIISIRPPF